MLRTGDSPHAVVQVNAARLAHKRRTFYVWRAWRRPVSSGLRAPPDTVYRGSSSRASYYVSRHPILPVHRPANVGNATSGSHTRSTPSLVRTQSVVAISSH